jgi:DNA modification methylase
LLGIPWMVAFALRAEGWHLRCDIVWSKPNSQPESVRDRPTKSHEYLFLLSKSPRYFYDWWAVREPCQSAPSDLRKMAEQLPRIGGLRAQLHDPLVNASAATPIGTLRPVGDPRGRNPRSVWVVPTASYREAHFATFPERLITPCVLAGSSAAGCCSVCGAPWERALEVLERAGHAARPDERFKCGGRGSQPSSRLADRGWRPTCAHGSAPRVPSTVLDPFAGSGTALAIASRLGRRALGVELNRAYLPLLTRRCEGRPAGEAPPQAA